MRSGGLHSVAGVPGRVLREDPFVLQGRPLRAGYCLEETTRFSADVWHLGPGLLAQHDRNFVLDFTRIPARHRGSGKALCYAMLSGTAPPGEDRPAVATVRTAFTGYVRFLRWAADRTQSMGALTGADLEDFQRLLLRTLTASSARQSARGAARKFWVWRHALPAGGLSFDPRHLDGWDEAGERSGEDATARIPEEVLGPLFVWSMRFITDFAPDILAAQQAWRTPPAVPAGRHLYGTLREELREWLEEQIAAGRPLPAWRGRPSVTAIAQILGRDRVGVGRYQHLIEEAAAQVGPRRSPWGESRCRVF